MVVSLERILKSKSSDEKLTSVPIGFRNRRPSARSIGTSTRTHLSCHRLGWSGIPSEPVCPWSSGHCLFQIDPWNTQYTSFNLKRLVGLGSSASAYFLFPFAPVKRTGTCISTAPLGTVRTVGFLVCARFALTLLVIRVLIGEDLGLVLDADLSDFRRDVAFG